MARLLLLVALLAAVAVEQIARAQTCVPADCPASDCQVGVCLRDACATQTEQDGAECSVGTCLAGQCVAGPSTTPGAAPPTTTQASNTGSGSGAGPDETTGPAPTTTPPRPEGGARVLAVDGSLTLAVRESKDVLIAVGADTPKSILGSVAEAVEEAKTLAATAERNSNAYTDLAAAQLEAAKANQTDVEDEFALLRAELGGVEAILGGQLDGLNITHGDQLGALETDLGAIDRLVATKASNTDLTTVSTLVQAILNCNDMGKFYSRATRACVSQPVQVTQNGGCSSTTTGQLVYQGGVLKVCDGTRFQEIKEPPLGSSATNPAASCSQIYTAGDDIVNGLHFIKDGSQVVRKYCEFTATAGIDRGGDGSSAAVATTSCANLRTYFGVNGARTVFVDLDGDTGTTNDVVQGVCNNGAFQGSDGSSRTKPAIACNSIPSATGRRWITPDLGVPFEVYCKGGWSLLMRITGSSSNHVRSNSASCNSIVNPNSGACRFSTNHISRFFKQPGVQVTRVDPDRGGYVSYYQRAASDADRWPGSLECNRRNSQINPDPTWRWILTSYSSESNARNNRSPDTGTYTGSNHFYPTPYARNQLFFCVGSGGMRINTSFGSSRCCTDRQSGTLWVK